MDPHYSYRKVTYICSCMNAAVQPTRILFYHRSALGVRLSLDPLRPSRSRRFLGPPWVLTTPYHIVSQLAKVSLHTSAHMQIELYSAIIQLFSL